MASRIYFKVFGNVQGIGYRWFVKATAEERKIVGWVRNVSDGTVEGEAQGAEEKLKNFLEDLREKHPFANVREIETREAEPRKDDCAFYIRRSK